MDKLVNNNNFALSRLSSGEFLEHYSIAKCQMKYREIRTVTQAIQNEESPSLVCIKNIYSEDFVLAYIEIWLYNLNDFFNLARKFNRAQISETAVYLYSDFYYLKLTEVNLVFIRIKKGSLGDFYQSIDGAVVYSYFKDYSQQRMDCLLKQKRLKEGDSLNMNDRATGILKLLNAYQNITK